MRFAAPAVFLLALLTGVKAAPTAPDSSWTGKVADVYSSCVKDCPTMNKPEKYKSANEFFETMFSCFESAKTDLSEACKKSLSHMQVEGAKETEKNEEQTGKEVELDQLDENERPMLQTVFTSCSEEFAASKCKANDENEFLECITKFISGHAPKDGEKKCRESLTAYTSLQSTTIDANRDMKTACSKEISEHCEGVSPGEGRVILCLLEVPAAALKGDCSHEVEMYKSIHLTSSIEMNWDFYQACAKDIKKLDCLSRTDSVLCMLSNIDKITSKDCVKEVQDYGRIKVSAMDLVPSLNKACSKDIEQCTQSGAKGGEDVMWCLFQRITDLEKTCASSFAELAVFFSQDIRNLNGAHLACEADIKKYCAETRVGDHAFEPGSTMACLSPHLADPKNGLSPECKMSVESIHVAQSLNIRNYPQMFEHCGDVVKEKCSDEIRMEKSEPAGGQVANCLIDLARKDEAKFTKENPVCLQFVQTIVQTQSAFIEADPIEKAACTGDLEKFCSDDKDVSPLDCLKKNFQELTETCKNEIAENEQVEHQAVKNDASYASNCAAMIELFCPNVKDEEGKVYECLQAHSNRKEFEEHKKCKAEVLEQVKEEAQFRDFSGELARVCAADFKKSCGPVYERKGLDKREQFGELLQCLLMKKTTSKGAVSNAECDQELDKLVGTQANIVSADVPLVRACKSDLEKFCGSVWNPTDESTQGEAFFCLMENVGALSAACKKEVGSNEIQQEGDIKKMGIFAQKCASDLAEYCKGASDEEALPCLIGVALMDERAEAGSKNQLSKGCGSAIDIHITEQGRDWRINFPLFVSCRSDSVKVCAGALSDADTLKEVAPGSMSECLISKREKLSKPCQEEVHMLVKTQDAKPESDPGLFLACQVDAGKLGCAKENDFIECLSHKDKSDISPDCLAQMEKNLLEKVGRVSEDHKLGEPCANELKTFCVGVPDKHAFECLQAFTHEKKFGQNCKHAVQERQRIEAADFRMNPELAAACDKEISSLCAAYLVPEKGEFSPGAVEECLIVNREKIKGDCADQIHAMVNIESQQVSADAQEADACKKDITSFCAGIEDEDGELFECLEANFDALSEPCRKEVQENKIEEASNPNENYSLATACRNEMKKFCKDVDSDSPEMYNCLEQRLESPGFSPACTAAVIQTIEDEQRDYRADAILKGACNGDMQKLCKSEINGDGSPKESGSVQICLVTFFSELSESCSREIKENVLLKQDFPTANPNLKKACTGVVSTFCSTVPAGEMYSCIEQVVWHHSEQHGPGKHTVEGPNAAMSKAPGFRDCQKEFLETERQVALVDGSSTLQLDKTCKKEIRAHCDGSSGASKVYCLAYFSGQSEFSHDCLTTVGVVLTFYSSDMSLLSGLSCSHVFKDATECELLGAQQKNLGDDGVKDYFNEHDGVLQCAFRKFGDVESVWALPTSSPHERSVKKCAVGISSLVLAMFRSYIPSRPAAQMCDADFDFCAPVNEGDSGDHSLPVVNLMECISDKMSEHGGNFPTLSRPECNTMVSLAVQASENDDHYTAATAAAGGKVGAAGTVKASAGAAIKQSSVTLSGPLALAALFALALLTIALAVYIWVRCRRSKSGGYSPLNSNKVM